MRPSSLQTLKTPIRSKPKENSHSQSKRSDCNPIEAAKPPKIIARSLASAFSTISDKMTADPSNPTALVTDPSSPTAPVTDPSSPTAPVTNLDMVAADPLEKCSITPAADYKKESIAMDTEALKAEETGSSEVVKEVAIIEEAGGEQGWSSDPATLLDLSVWIVLILTLAVTAAGWLIWWNVELKEECSSLPPT